MIIIIIMNIERGEKKKSTIAHNVWYTRRAAADSPLAETMSQHLNKTLFVGSTRTDGLRINVQLNNIIDVPYRYELGK